MMRGNSYQVVNVSESETTFPPVITSGLLYVKKHFPQYYRLALHSVLGIAEVPLFSGVDEPKRIRNTLSCIKHLKSDLFTLENIAGDEYDDERPINSIVEFELLRYLHGPDFDMFVDPRAVALYVIVVYHLKCICNDLLWNFGRHDSLSINVTSKLKIVEQVMRRISRWDIEFDVEESVKEVVDNPLYVDVIDNLGDAPESMYHQPFFSSDIHSSAEPYRYLADHLRSTFGYKDWNWLRLPTKGDKYYRNAEDWGRRELAYNNTSIFYKTRLTQFACTMDRPYGYLTDGGEIGMLITPIPKSRHAAKNSEFWLSKQKKPFLFDELEFALCPNYGFFPQRIENLQRNGIIGAFDKNSCENNALAVDYALEISGLLSDHGVHCTRGVKMEVFNRIFANTPHKFYNSCGTDLYILKTRMGKHIPLASGVGLSFQQVRQTKTINGVEYVRHFCSMCGMICTTRFASQVCGLNDLFSTKSRKDRAIRNVFIMELRVNFRRLHSSDPVYQVYMERLRLKGSMGIDVEKSYSEVIPLWNKFDYIFASVIYQRDPEVTNYIYELLGWGAEDSIAWWCDLDGVVEFGSPCEKRPAKGNKRAREIRDGPLLKLCERKGYEKLSSLIKELQRGRPRDLDVLPIYDDACTFAEFSREHDDDFLFQLMFVRVDHGIIATKWLTAMYRCLQRICPCASRISSSLLIRTRAALPLIIFPNASKGSVDNVLKGVDAIVGDVYEYDYAKQYFPVGMQHAMDDYFKDIFKHKHNVLMDPNSLDTINSILEPVTYHFDEVANAIGDYYLMPFSSEHGNVPIDMRYDYTNIVRVQGPSLM